MRQKLYHANCGPGRRGVRVMFEKTKISAHPRLPLSPPDRVNPSPLPPKIFRTPAHRWTYRLMIFSSSFAGLKCGTLLSGTSTRAPVFGFHPTRAPLWCDLKLPNPRSSTLSPRFSAPAMPAKIASTMALASVRRTSIAPVRAMAILALVKGIR